MELPILDHCVCIIQKGANKMYYSLHTASYPFAQFFLAHAMVFDCSKKVFKTIIKSITVLCLIK